MTADGSRNDPPRYPAEAATIARLTAELGEWKRRAIEAETGLAVAREHIAELERRLDTPAGRVVMGKGEVRR